MNHGDPLRAHTDFLQDGTGPFHPLGRLPVAVHIMALTGKTAGDQNSVPPRLPAPPKDGPHPCAPCKAPGQSARCRVTHAQARPCPPPHRNTIGNRSRPREARTFAGPSVHPNFLKSVAMSPRTPPPEFHSRTSARSVWERRGKGNRTSSRLVRPGRRVCSPWGAQRRCPLGHPPGIRPLAVRHPVCRDTKGKEGKTRLPDRPTAYLARVCAGSPGQVKPKRRAMGNS